MIELAYTFTCNACGAQHVEHHTVGTLRLRIEAILPAGWTSISTRTDEKHLCHRHAAKVVAA